MKNSAPADRSHKAPPSVPPIPSSSYGRSAAAAKLTPAVSRFIEGMGVYFENSGVPRIGGRMLGLLLIAHQPLSAEVIASVLKVSRASISTNLRILQASGLVEKVTLHADRTTYFIFPESGLERRMTAGIQSTIAYRKLMEQGLSALSPEDSGRQRLEESLAWSDLIIDSFERAIHEWRTRPRDEKDGCKIRYPNR